MTSLKPYEINSNNVTQTWININSNSVPNFNSIVTFDVNQLGKVQEIYVLFNMSAITGVTGVPAQFLPCPVSAFKFFTTVNYSYQGSILDTTTNDMNYITNQFAHDDQDRLFINTGSGMYNVQSQRYALGQANTIYQVPLRSFVNQTNPEILNNNHAFRVSLTMDSLQNIVDTGLLVGIPSMTINSISLLVKMQKFDTPTINYKLNQLGRLGRYQDIFSSNLQQQFTAIVGSTSSIINLPNFINSNINYIYFTIRPITSLTKSVGFNYINNIISYNLNNSSNESLCGGSPVVSSIGLLVLNRENTRGSYCTELNASVFAWFHTSDGVRTLATGIPLSSRLYNGSENLTLQWSSALLVNHQIDIYASAVSVFQQTLLGVSKL